MKDTPAAPVSTVPLPERVVLDGRNGPGVSVADVVAVARGGASVHLGDRARVDMAASAISEMHRYVASDSPVYGVTTGFGSLAGTVIPAERTAELQVALVR